MSLDFQSKLSWLKSPQGREALAELADQPLKEDRLLSHLTRLRQRYAPELAAAAVDQAMLRRRGAEKFSDADRMFFIREALEQSTGQHVSTHRAARFARYGLVADCCCGIGGDTIALARAGCRVIGTDQDADRLAAAEANVEALGLADRVTFQHADLIREGPPGGVDAIFCDPGRRAEGRRRFRVETYEPPLSKVIRWADGVKALAAKLSPGVRLDELHGLPPHRLEFISLDGELKEAVLWAGDFATELPGAGDGPIATVLKVTPEGCATHVLVRATTDSAESSPRPPEGYLYEPDPAVIRAGLVGQLAQHLDAAQVDPSIAYLTAANRVSTPFARAWRIVEWMPFHLKRLRARLRDLDAGEVTVKKRGSAMDSDALARQLTGGGAVRWVVVLTLVLNEPAAILCQPIES